MISSLVRKVFGSRNERLLKQYRKSVVAINALEAKFSSLNDTQLQEYQASLRERVKNGEKLDSLLPESFALVREASKRALGMRHFDVQLIGGITLHNGQIAEMRTGEGKTLVATLPACLNALSGYGVHIVTVNDYLARRDATWMTPVYEALGLTVGVVVHGMGLEEKQAAYAADIIYGTNNEFGFDYLRDNMAFSAKERMQGKLSYAIVDEVDSILIDEARTPLIISGADQDSSELYKTINKMIPQLSLQEEKDGPGDFSLDEKSKQAFLTEVGHQKVEEILEQLGLLQPGASLYDAQNINLVHHIYAALRAHGLYKKDVEYIVKNNEVVIVDEHTGRTMPGRRWSEGLHQAVEAKEGVAIQSENQTLASITFQNYFRLYDKLAGMTGTADTEAFEFQQIYGLEVVVIPTNQGNQRQDLPDLIYLTLEEKWAAIIEDIKDCVQRKQPVLVGTISIETSEFLSDLLKKQNIPHQVLNAKFHEQEAEIIAEAGRPAKVTIATNMAGRGTDIVLGGNLEAELTKQRAMVAAGEEIDVARFKAEWQQRHQAVISAGGLHIIGTERHESRRIDNQLRGRSGRQGDPGSTRFYLSIRDNLMRIFISDSLSGFLNKLGMSKGEAISAGVVTKAVENAQRKVEGYNFDIRKQLLDFDNVANDQRKVIYQQRNELMETEDVSETIQDMQRDVIKSVMEEFIPPQSIEDQWQVAELEKCLEQEFGQKIPVQQWLSADKTLHADKLCERLVDYFLRLHGEKSQQIGVENMRHLEKVIMLNVLDSNWKEHLATMDYVRQSIHLRGYAQKDPKQEYKREAFTLFTGMLEAIKREVVGLLAKIHVQAETDVTAVDESMRKETTKLQFHHDQAETIISKPSAHAEHDEHAEHNVAHEHPYVREQPKVGRNDPCPCGSGRKYKQCHGKISNVGS
jgi:preprotein translocase subunit SecA